MKRINVCLGVLVLVLAVYLSETVSGAWAYFTTYTQARAIQTMDISGAQVDNTGIPIPDIDLDPDTYPPEGEYPANPTDPTIPEVSADNSTPTDPVVPGDLPVPTNPTDPVTPPPLQLEEHTVLIEDVVDWAKRISVYNSPGIYYNSASVPVYVRIKAFAGKAYSLSFSDPDGKWTYHADDGYYYYDEVLGVGETTSTLDIQIGSVPMPAAVGDTFNVVVVKEVVPVTYQRNGDPMPADWTAQLVVND